MKNSTGKQSFETDGVNLFVSRFERLISASESGQLAIRELIKAHLRRIEHDASGVAARLYPFTRQNGLDQPKIVVIDPLVSFGRPSIAGTEIATNKEGRLATPLAPPPKRFGAQEAVWVRGDCRIVGEAVSFPSF